MCTEFLVQVQRDLTVRARPGVSSVIRLIGKLVKHGSTRLWLSRCDLLNLSGKP
jgi:hypothetical protein